MGKYSKSYFENPYLEENGGQSKYSAEVIMEEARQKWRVGSWRARAEDFELDRAELTADSDSPDGEQTADAAETAERAASERPTAARFKLDIQRDLTGDSISRRTLQQLDYSPSYRPSGKIEDRLVGARSTLQRYDVLAGELEAPPEDMSFVTDPDARREREERQGETHSGALRRDTRRLESSVDERRSELIRMLPDEDEGAAAQIVKETARRRSREDAEIGRVKKKKAKRRYTPVEEQEPPKPQPTREELREQIPPESFAGSRLERLPQDNGMGESSAALPEFSTEARYWSQITEENPSWSQVAAHSVHTVPVEEDSREFDGRYIRPDDESGSEFGITPTRARVRSTEAGEFKNEYIKEANIDPERIKRIMEHNYRGRWIPPEYYSDDALVEDYFHALSSGQTAGEDFLTWAYHRKQAEYQQRMMAEQARRQHIKAVRAVSRAGRRQPSSREELLRQYEQARQQGYQQGAAMSRDKALRQSTTMPGYDPYGGYAAYAGFMPPYAGFMPPYGGMPQPGANGQYQGLYPELFEGGESRPEYYYQQQYRQVYHQPPQGTAPAAQQMPQTPPSHAGQQTPGRPAHPMVHRMGQPPMPQPGQRPAGYPGQRPMPQQGGANMPPQRQQPRPAAGGHRGAQAVQGARQPGTAARRPQDGRG